MFAKIYDTEIKIDYNQVDGFNRYPNDIMAEYQQSVEEGLDIEGQKELFLSVAAMENGEEKTRMSDKIFETVINAEIRPDYKYNEPNKLEEIKKLRMAYDFDGEIPDERTLKGKL